MTVSGSTYKNTYTLDSSTTVFPYTFKIIQDSDMLVTLYNTSDNTSTTVSSSEYTIVGAGNDTGTRTVTWANAASYGSAYQLILQSNAAYTQPTDYEEGDDFAQETHELALDRLSIQIRQLVELINRTLKLDVSTTTASSIADNAGYLYSDGSGNLSFGTPSGVSDTLPALSTGDSGKALRVNGDEDAFELYDLPYDSDNNGTFANFSAVNIDASGNVTVDGALAVTGATSLASLNLATGSTITSILDEDLMTSNSATALATQQSIKAYVDSVAPSDARIKAWAVVKSDGTLLDSFNVSSVVKGGTGIYTVNWDTDFASANYAIAAMGYDDGIIVSANSAPVAGSVQISVRLHDGTVSDKAFGIIAMGDQA